MNIIDYLYYNVYCWYNNMKLSGRKVDPLNMTSTVFGLCFTGWTLIGIFLYYHFTQKRMENDGWVIAVLIGFFGSFIIDSIYNSTKERYLKVYNYYSSFSQLSRRPIVFSLLFLMLPYLIIVPYLIIILCVNIYKGY